MRRRTSRRGLPGLIACLATCALSNPLASWSGIPAIDLGSVRSAYADSATDDDRRRKRREEDLEDLVGDSLELPEVPRLLPDPSAFEGVVVVAVSARVRGGIWTKLPTVNSPTPGSKFSLASARAELNRLLGAGGFASGSIEANVDGKSGVEVVYVLTPSRLVRRVAIKDSPLPEEDIRRAAGLSDVRDVTERTLRLAGAKAQKYLRRRGFRAAIVEAATLETDSPTTAIVELRVVAGPETTIRSRTFKGLPGWDPDALGAARNYAVTVGARADEETLAAADRALANELRSRGFPSTTVTHLLDPDTLDRKLSKDRVVTDLRIDIDSGAKVIPIFEGNTHLDRNQLLDVLDLKGEADRSPARLAQKIEGAYVRRGYLDAFVTGELRGAVTDTRRTLLMRVREGSRVKVTERTFPCLRGVLDQKRLEREIDSFLEEELDPGFFDADPAGIDDAFGGNFGRGVSRGSRPSVELPTARGTFIPEVYERAIEHLRELYRSEGYLFAEIGAATIVRATCDPRSPPETCSPLPHNVLPDLCRQDEAGLPKEASPVPKSLTCTPDPFKNVTCAPEANVVIPVNPGPRSILWDVAFDGTRLANPTTLLAAAGPDLHLGQPLSLKDIDDARRKIVEYYKDSGFAFASAKASLEYSPDRSRARVRFSIFEGEQVIIEDIIIEGGNRTNEGLMRDRLLIEKGGFYRAKLVRKSQDQLTQLGVFSSVSIAMANPTIPARRKTVIVSVVERPPQHFEMRPGFSTGEGLRYYSEYGYNNLFGYAVGIDFRLRLSYQPFLNFGSGASGFYDPVVVQRWTEALSGTDKVPRRVSTSITIPQTPLLGAPVRTTIEFVNILDLRRDYKLERYSPIITFTYQPQPWLSTVFAADLEYNDFLLFENGSIKDVLGKNPSLEPLLRVPDGRTGVGALRISLTADFRDNRLNATKNGYASISNEYVRTVFKGTGTTRQDFMHTTAAAGYYLRLPFLWKSPVLAMELKGGMNSNVFSCKGEPNDVCNTYPDRLFYLGGIDSNRGFFPWQMLSQDIIDEINNNPSLQKLAEPCLEGAAAGTCGTNLRDIALRGGNVFVNPRIELRIPAFSWGGIVIFLDAANSWFDRSKVKPWVLRYAVGPGLSIDTPVGPVALDIGFNLSRYAGFDEPLAAFHFSIGRF